MEATKPNFSLIKKIKDDKLDVDHLENYELSLHIGKDDFQISIFDVNNRCLLLEDYNLVGVNTADDYLEILSGIIDSHHLAKAGFWKEVKVSFKNNKCTLIPSSLFDDSRASEYFNAVLEIKPESEEVHYYVHSKRNFVSVFAIDKKIYNWICNVYPTVRVLCFHQSSIIIEGVLHYDDHPLTEGVFIVQNRNELHISVTARKKLQYYNQFSYNSPEEFTRYILLVLQQLQLDPNQIRVVVWGDLDAASSNYQNIYKYIRHISFAKKPSFLKLNFQFDELNDHEYMDLYSISLF